jgi:glycine cleavage system H protein
MDYPSDLKYTSTHEWIRVEGNKVVVGLTDFAQHELSDVVYVELPGVGDEVSAEGACAVVESVKSASDIYSPVSGTVARVNEGVNDSPDIVNKDPYGEGWLFEVELSDPSELGQLMDVQAYRKQVESEKV